MTGRFSRGCTGSRYSRGSKSSRLSRGSRGNRLSRGSVLFGGSKLSVLVRVSIGSAGTAGTAGTACSCRTLSRSMSASRLFSTFWP